MRVFDKLKVDGGSAPGIDGLTYSDFNRAEMAAVLRTASASLVVINYRPRPTRQILIPKSNGGHRRLRLMTVVDRVVAKAVQVAITPALDPLFGPQVFGFREGRSVQHMLLAIAKAAQEEDRWVIAQDDIQAAFDNLSISDVMADFRRHLGDEHLLWLVETLLRGSAGQSRKTGCDQGNAVSPIALLLRLHHTLGTPQPQGAAGQDHPPRQYMYADNIVCLCGSVTEGKQALQRAGQLLQANGLRLKGEDGPPVNLKRQGARAEILGFCVELSDGGLRFSAGKKAWSGLQQALESAHEAANPLTAAMAVVRGWTAANGLAFEGIEERDLLERIRGITAQAGFRGIGKETEALSWLREARRRWLAARNTMGRPLVQF